MVGCREWGRVFFRDRCDPHIPKSHADLGSRHPIPPFMIMVFHVDFEDQLS